MGSHKFPTNRELQRRQILSPIDSSNHLQKVVTRNDIESDHIHHSRKVDSLKPLKGGQIEIYNSHSIHSPTRHLLLQQFGCQTMKRTRSLHFAMERQSETSEEHKEAITHTSLLFETHSDHHTRRHQHDRDHELQCNLEDAVGNVVHDVRKPWFSLLRSRMIASVPNRLNHAARDGIANRCSASSVQIGLQKRVELDDSTETPEKRNRETNRPPDIGSNPVCNRRDDWLHDSVDETPVEMTESQSGERHHDDHDGKMGSEETRK